MYKMTCVMGDYSVTYEAPTIEGIMELRSADENDGITRNEHKNSDEDDINYQRLKSEYELKPELLYCRVHKSGHHSECKQCHEYMLARMAYIRKDV